MFFLILWFHWVSVCSFDNFFSFLAFFLSRSVHVENAVQHEICSPGCGRVAASMVSGSSTESLGKGTSSLKDARRHKSVSLWILKHGESGIIHSNDVDGIPLYTAAECWTSQMVAIDCAGVC